MCALEMTTHAPAEFQLHRRRRRDERFGEKVDKLLNLRQAPKLLNLRPHRSHRDARSRLSTRVDHVIEDERDARRTEEEDIFSVDDDVAIRVRDRCPSPFSVRSVVR